MKSVELEYKDIGTCLRYVGKKQVFKSKFKTSKDAEEQLNRLKQINVIDPSSGVYKCTECKKWHIGKNG